jgi:predicted glycogen debranching enzyme
MTGPVLVFPWKPDNDLNLLLSREWLVTNGLGGYASGTLLGVPTRRYHGPFIPNLPAPIGRIVMIPRLDDEIQFDDRMVRLGGAEFRNGKIEGEGHLFLREFRREWQTPIWVFEIAGHTLEKRVIMPHDQNTTYVDYRLLKGGPIRLNLRPYVSFRGHDEPLPLEDPSEWPFTITIIEDRYEVHPSKGGATLKLCMRPYHGVFVAERKVSKNVLYRVEQERGYEHVDNLFSPGYFTVEITHEKSVALVGSTESWDTLEPTPDSILEAERQRLRHLLDIAPKLAPMGTAAQLVIAAEQFVIFPGTRPEERVLAHASGNEARTIVAGYHWFTDWGRDTMISLEGLTLCTGRHQEAREILRTFSHYIKDGLLPNHFPEGERTAIYNTVDATFWYFHAIDRYYQTTGDIETLKMLYPVLKSIIEHHVKGTDFGIGMDKDGLIKAGADGFQLTWMDAKVGDWVVTPRRGKPVEIQALWYNALRLMVVWAEDLGESSEGFLSPAKRAHDSFNTRFWFEQGRYLFDVIDGENGDDPSLRPNQIFSMSLRFPILIERFWRPVIDAVVKNLLTPVGLRSLAPGSKNYHSRYYGDRRHRDAAYHQGTVWPWLIGNFLDAWRRVYTDKKSARALLRGLEEHLRDVGIGTISEIFDADPPYTPRGCFAQAWSVAEVLRAILAMEGDD